MNKNDLIREMYANYVKMCGQATKPSEPMPFDDFSEKALLSEEAFLISYIRKCETRRVTD